MKKSSTANSSHKSNIFTPFKFQFYLLLILISGLLSCSDNKSTTESQSNYQPTPLSEQVTDLFIVEGNLKSDTVWIYEQGGHNPRPMDADWVLDIQEQCKKSDVAFFFKQWGGKNKKKNGRILNGRTYDEMPELDLQLSV